MSGNDGQLNLAGPIGKFTGRSLYQNGSKHCTRAVHIEGQIEVVIYSFENFWIIM